MRLVALLLIVWAGIVAAIANPATLHYGHSQSSTWMLPGVIADFDFVNQRYWQSGQIATQDRVFVFTRALAAYQDNIGGVWSPFPTGVMRITDKGVLSELAALNSALWSRDLSNAAWVKSNTTAAQTATGIDGIANSASTLTAASASSTVLQTITLGSQADVYSAWLKRRTGTGTVNMTMDNGSSWTTVVLSPSTTYQRFQILKTAANPVFGFQLGTSGDAIDVDFAQLEAGSIATSPILTTTVGVSRPADAIAWRTAIPISIQNGTVYVEWQHTQTGNPMPVGGQLWQIRVDGSNSMAQTLQTSGKPNMTVTSGGGTTFSGTATGTAVANNGIYRAAFSFAALNFATSYTSSLHAAVLTQASGAVPIGDPTGFGIGGSATGSTQCNCYIRRLAYSSAPVQAAALVNWAQAQ